MLFFEWIAGLEVSGEKKMGCVPCPITKTCYDFYASTQKEIGIQVLRGFRVITHVLPVGLETYFICKKTVVWLKMLTSICRKL